MPETRMQSDVEELDERPVKQEAEEKRVGVFEGAYEGEHSCSSVSWPGCPCRGKEVRSLHKCRSLQA